MLIFIIFGIVAYTFLLGMALRIIFREIYEVLTSKKSLIVLEVVKLICLFILLLPLSIIGCPVAIYLACKKYYLERNSRKRVRFLCKKLAQDEISLTEVTMDYSKKQIREIK